MEFYTKAFFVGLAILVGYLLMLVLQPFAGSMAWAIFVSSFPTAGSWSDRSQVRLVRNALSYSPPGGVEMG